MLAALQPWKSTQWNCSLWPKEAPAAVLTAKVKGEIKVGVGLYDLQRSLPAQLVLWPYKVSLRTSLLSATTKNSQGTGESFSPKTLFFSSQKESRSLLSNEYRFLLYFHRHLGIHGQ